VTGAAAAWSDILGADEAGILARSNIYGMAAQADRVLLAWGTYNTLYLAVFDTSGALVGRAHYPDFFDLGSTMASAIPWGTGLLLFDGNGSGAGGVRLTQIGFDLSRTTLGDNKQMRAFYRTTPRVAGVALPAVPLAFWLTVFPQTDNSQGYTTHQLYGCVLDLAAPASCVTTALIAATGLDGYGIADEPVAAAAFSDGSTFAIAHTDVNGRSWLRVANFSCAPPPPAP